MSLWSFQGPHGLESNTGSNGHTLKNQQRTSTAPEAATARRVGRISRRAGLSGRPESSNGAGACRSKSSGIPRKEVIQPQLPLRLPCYDFTPIIDPTLDGSLPCGLGHRLRVLPTFVV